MRHRTLRAGSHAWTSSALIVIGTVLSVLASACGADQPVLEIYAARDSAGVEIVENRSNAPGVAEWVLTDQPLAEVGRDEDSPGHMLNQVVAGFRLGSGDLVVGDRGSGEVRFFGPTGEHRRSVGGQGEGPGEFRLLIAVDLFAGDTIVAGAWPLGLRVWWDSAGEFITNTESGRWGPGLVGGRTLPDGTFLIDTYEFGSYGNSLEFWAAQGEESTFRTEGTLLRVSRQGEPLDTIGPVIGEEWFKIGEIRAASFAMRARPYTYRTHLAFNDRQIFLGENNLGEVRAYAYDGTLERVIRWEQEHTPVTGGDRRRFRQQVLNELNNPTRRPSFERWLPRSSIPSRSRRSDTF